MAIVLTLFLIALLLLFGLRTICLARTTKEYSCTGHRTLSRMSKWERRRMDAWEVFPLKQFQSITARLVYLDEATATKLRKTLSKAMLTVTPQEYTARKVLIVVFGLGLTALCFFASF